MTVSITTYNLAFQHKAARKDLTMATVEVVEGPGKVVPWLLYFSWTGNYLVCLVFWVNLLFSWQITLVGFSRIAYPTVNCQVGRVKKINKDQKTYLKSNY